MLQYAAPVFDASVSELSVTLSSGGCLVLPPPGELLAGPDLARVVTRLGITHLTVPPAVLATLDPGGLPSLRTLVTAGEALSREMVTRWAAGGGSSMPTGPPRPRSAPP